MYYNILHFPEKMRIGRHIKLLSIYQTTQQERGTRMCLNVVIYKF